MCRQTWLRAVLLVVTAGLLSGSAGADAIPTWLPRYQLALDIQPEQRLVSAVQRVTFTNRHQRPTQELVFCAYSRYRVPEADVPIMAKTLELVRARPSDGIDFEGRRLTVHRATSGDGQAALPFRWAEDNQTTLIVQLPQPVRQGESVTIELAFSLSLPEKEGRWGYTHGVLTLANWYPVLAYYDEQGWQPTPFVAWHQPFFNEAGVYSASVRLPAAYKTAHTGTLVNRTDNADGTQTLEIVAAAARDFTIVASTRYQQWSRQVENHTVHVLAFPEHHYMAEKALEFACEVIPLYNRWFGTYPFTDFYIVEGYFPWNGNENAGLIQIDHRVFGMPKMMVRYLDHLVSHETLHQWWWNVVGTNGYAETFMDEGVVCYFTAVRLRKKYGHNFQLLELPFGQEVLPNVSHEGYRFYGLYGTLARKEETKTVQPLPDFGHLVTLFSMCYDRGAKVLGMIEDRIGEAAFFDFMRLVYARYQFRILRVADFQRELEEYTGTSWQEFFDRWLYGVGSTDWAVTQVDLSTATEPGLDATRSVAITLEQRAEFTEPTVLGIKFDRSGSYDLRVPVTPGPPMTAYDLNDPPGRIETLPDGKSVRVVLRLPQAPQQISVDPDQVLLDRQPANNHWKCELNTRITPLLTNLDETDLTTMYDRWNLTAGPWIGTNLPQFGQRPYAGLRASLYRLQTFQGGVYTAFDGVDYDLRAGADLLFKHLPWPNWQMGFQFDHSLTPDWADLRRDRGRLFSRYIITETPSLYLDPIHFVEGYARVEQSKGEGRFVPAGVESYNSFSALGMRYYRNYQTPYWDPEGGYKLDFNYELGVPVVGDYNFVYNRVQGEASLVKGLPEDLGYFSATRLAFRLYGGIGLPANGYHFQLGGPNLLRGFQRNDREGDSAWVGTVEWRFPFWQRADIHCCDHIFHLNSVSGAAFADVGEIYLNGQSVGGIAYSMGGGLRLDVTLLGFLERVTLRFDAAKVVNADEPVQYWIGLSQAF